jgi:Lsr2
VAQRTIVRLVDDLDGKELKAASAERVAFSLDGISYEIDLGARNAKALRAVFAPYIEAGRRTSRGGARRTRTARGLVSRRDPQQAKAIRDWARAGGHAVSERGRISAEILAAYESGH